MPLLETMPGYVPFYRRRWLLGCGVLAIVVGALFSRWAGQREENCLQQRLTQYALQGEPVRFSDLDRAIPRIADSENLASHLGGALEAREGYLGLATTELELNGLPFIGRRSAALFVWDESACQEAEAYLEANTTWMAVLEKSSSYAAFGPRTFADIRVFSDVTLPYGVALDHGVKCLCLQALVLAHRGQMDGALQSLNEAKSLGRKLLDEPFLVRVLTSIACDRVIFRAVCAILEQVNISDDPAWAAGLEPLTVPLGEPWVVRALQFERLAGLDFYYARAGTAHSDETTSLSYLRSFPDGLALGKVNEYLDYIDGSILAMTLPRDGGSRTARAIEGVRERRGYLRNPLLSLGPPILGLVMSYRNYIDDAMIARTMVTERIITASAGARPSGGVAADRSAVDELPVSARVGE
ncbi:MAG: hypothetical protein A3K18_11120 [Lentisphaerae bacterium RIFOXYA12_64_32]|nr:MAG: hypothetical protein A3K18_11120 [Lentisphaerae bacterium RIFOXYA12_64_32]